MENQNEKPPRALTLVLVGVLLLAVIVLAFSVGIWVGQERAQFSFRWAENYHKNFGGPKEGFFGNFPQKDFTIGHGLFGPIITIDGNTIIIKGQDSVEKTVIVSDKTSLIFGSKKVAITDIKVGDFVIIIGSPNDKGQIDAKLIRLMPDQPAMMRYGTINRAI